MTDLVYHRDPATRLQITNQMHLERHPFRDEVCESMYRLPKNERDVVEKIVSMGLLEETRNGFYISVQLTPADGYDEFLKPVNSNVRC